jgi:hypothetical protein
MKLALSIFVLSLFLFHARPASAQPAYSECLLGWQGAQSEWGWVLDKSYGVDMLHNAGRDNPDKLGAQLAELTERATATHRKAAACNPQVSGSKLEKVNELRAKTEEIRTSALAHAKLLRQHLDLAKQCNALRAAIQASDGSQHAAFATKVKELDGAVRAAMANNPQLTAEWHRRIFAVIERDLAQEAQRAVAVAAAAERKHVIDHAVVARSPAFKDDDSYDPARVADAFKAASKEQLVHVKVRGQIYAPGRQNHYERTSRQSGAKRAAHIETNDVAVYPIYNQSPESPPIGTPGLAWSTDAEGYAIFVAMDGGRYRTPVNNLAVGVGAPDTWMKAPSNTIVLDDDVPFLAERGVLPAKLAKTLAGSAAAYLKCTEGLWKSARRTMDQIKTQNLLKHVRDARIQKVRGDTLDKIDRSCGGSRKTYEKTWEALVSAFEARRAKTLEVVRARLIELAGS